MTYVDGVADEVASADRGDTKVSGNELGVGALATAGSAKHDQTEVLRRVGRRGEASGLGKVEKTDGRTRRDRGEAGREHL